MVTKCTKCGLQMDVISSYKSKDIVWTCPGCLKTVSKKREEFIKREIITI
ncbi:MAG: hypothetical protein ACE5J5_02430 [Candidatus Hydrothermarchaeales archaeon]